MKGKKKNNGIVIKDPLEATQAKEQLINRGVELLGSIELGFCKLGS